MAKTKSSKEAGEEEEIYAEISEEDNSSKVAPDTSVLVEGLVSSWVRKGKIAPDEIIIHEAVLAELEHQANQNRAIGFLGLEELERLNELAKKGNFKLRFAGKRPTAAEIRYANLGEIDSMIRELAYEEGAALLTADKVLSRVARAKGVPVLFVSIDKIHKKLKLEKYFDEQTMSVHLRENVLPYAKKGYPGKWSFVAVGTKPLTRENVEAIARELVEEAGVRKDGFIEIERTGSTIIQLGSFRIVITRPPFSDGWEITAVRPVKRLSLEDYELDEKLVERLTSHAEGILIAGSPGHGKSTFAQALAESYAKQGKVVKTVEAPRDLVLPDNITQYAISHGDAQEIHDILLLSRPDYTIFDEMRNTDDFRLFADLRLSGVGMVGVVHATNPIDAIQRFVGRIELGVIPQVIDTVIFIKNGEPKKVLSLVMTVKVPAGMTEADLARPVVVVSDFISGSPEYELYSYGEETVVVPVTQQRKTPSQELAQKTVLQEIRRYADSAEAEVVSDHKAIVYVPERDISRIIGKQGKTISEIEKKLGISIDVKPLSNKEAKKAEPVSFSSRIHKSNVQLMLDHAHRNKDIEIYVDGDYLLTAKASKSGLIKISRKNKLGRILHDAIVTGGRVELFAK